MERYLLLAIAVMNFTYTGGVALNAFTVIRTGRFAPWSMMLQTFYVGVAVAFGVWLLDTGGWI